MPIETPWGEAQTIDLHAEGIAFHSTASHGGFKLDRERNILVRPLWRNDTGFYEEDCEAAIVIVTFPELFPAKTVAAAHQTAKNWFPEAYEQLFSVVLEPGESIKKDQQDFRRQHAEDWIVISAITSQHRPGFVECVASKGGVRGRIGERRFLVPATEYRQGRHGFIIDQARHAPYDGKSSFPTFAD